MSALRSGASDLPGDVPGEAGDRKYCRKGNHWPPLSEFSRDSKRRDGLSPTCKGCTAETARKRRARRAEQQCILDGCDRPQDDRASGYCVMHHKRIKQTGVPGPPEAYADLRASECSYCETPGKVIYDSTYLDGPLCEMHQGRWRRHRDLGPKERITRRAPPDGECTHVGAEGAKCRGRYVAAGYCPMHYQRVAAGRSPDDPGVDVRIAPEVAVEQMLRAGVKPLEPYPGGTTLKWKCRCLRCRRIIYPALEGLRRAKPKHPCWKCSGSRVDPVEAEDFMLRKGLQVLDPWPGRVDRPWRGIHVGTSETPGCLGEVAPTYNSVKSHKQGVCFDCGIRGYSRQKPGTFYVVEDGEIVKCGIANMASLTRRLAMHRAQGLAWTRLIGFRDGFAPWQLEREWKGFRLDHPRLHVPKSRLADGYTEAMVKAPLVAFFLDQLLDDTSEAGPN